MPVGKSVRIGVWEDESFRGMIIFSRGANRNIGKPFGLKQTEVCELTRVALRSHMSPVSRMLRIAMKLLRECFPDVRLLISYADSGQGHHGGIYQATNWVYVGGSSATQIRVFGKLKHEKAVTSLYGRNDLSWLREHIDPEAERLQMPPKHKYALAIDRSLQPMLEKMRKPYPK
jgi:hypothetical protein